MRYWRQIEHLIQECHSPVREARLDPVALGSFAAKGVLLRLSRLRDCRGFWFPADKLEATDTAVSSAMAVVNLMASYQDI